ncbi:MAG: serine/threonine-protein kinase [Pseudomonadota bacterium]
MTRDEKRWRLLNDLLAEALEQPAEQRQAWIKQASDGDASLEAELRELLKYDAEATGDLHASIASASARATDTLIGNAIGPYRITDRIAEGGMGVVYAGEREGSDFEQRVAVKVMHSHQLDEVATARFVAERRILAALNHPNIAGLIDGGMTDEGLPYIVMEYVDGESIADYCKRETVDNERIIQLVIDVCGALQYAHNQLVIHRDIKPSNILVDKNGTPRLLDFGIAKLMEPDGTGGKQTRPEWRAVTPLYASPEQLGNQPVSTAADVYGVGLLLYRLLTGRLPYSPTSDHPRDVESAIISSPAELPSSAVTRADGTASAQWAQRQRRALRGDLDTILLKALRKEPQRRYATIEALADDLQRYLDQMPIRARRDTLAYRARKFVARNRLPVALVSLLVVSAIGLTTFYTKRLETERAVAQQTADFLTDLFVDANPYRRSRDGLTVAELVNVGAEQVQAKESLDPIVRARLQSTIATVFNYVGESEKSEDLLNQAIPLFEAAGENGDLGKAVGALARVRQLQGRYDDGLALLDRADALFSAEFGARSLEVAGTACARGYMSYRAGYYDMTLESSLRALSIYEELLPASDYQFHCPFTTLSTYYQITGQAQKAIEYESRALELTTEEFGPNDPRNAGSLYGIGIILTDLGRYREAMEHYERAYDIWYTVSEGKSAQLPLVLYGMAHVTGKLGDFAKSHRRFKELVELQIERSGDTHDTVAYWLNGHGDMLANIGATELANAALTRAMSIYETNEKPEGHFDRSVTLVGLGKVARDRGDLATAEELMKEGLRIRESTIGVDNTFTQLARIDLAHVFFRQGRLTDARTEFDAALAILEKKGQSNHPTAAQALTGLARVALAEGDYGVANDLLARSIEMTQTSIGRDHLDNLDRRLLIADAIEGAGDPDRAKQIRASATAQREAIMNDWLASLEERGSDS